MSDTYSNSLSDSYQDPHMPSVEIKKKTKHNNNIQGIIKVSRIHHEWLYQVSCQQLLSHTASMAINSNLYDNNTHTHDNNHKDFNESYKILTDIRPCVHSSVSTVACLNCDPSRSCRGANKATFSHLTHKCLQFILFTFLSSPPSPVPTSPFSPPSPLLSPSPSPSPSLPPLFLSFVRLGVSF